MVKNFFSILSSRQSSILSGASILMVTVFASRFLGLLRDRLLNHYFTSGNSQIFWAAFNLPDLLFQVLVLGALSVAFVPIFTEYLHKSEEKEAFEFASNILNLSLLAFGVLSLIAFILIDPINHILVPGFTEAQRQTTDTLTRIILFPQLLLVIGSFFIGVSNSYQRFIAPALAPFLYNLGIILGIIFLSPRLGLLGPALGVVLGAMLHVVIQIPLMKAVGFKYQFSFNFFNKGVQETFKLMSIRNIGLIVEQISDKVSFAFASIIASGAPTLLTYAQHLYFVPIGLFGSTIAQVALPVLSREYTKGEKESFKITLLTTMHQILFLSLPAAAILIVLRIPVVRLIFGASQFSWDDTVSTAMTVAFMAVGLASQSAILLLVRGFYATKDTKTPVAVSIITVAINVILAVLFVPFMHLAVWSLGLAYAVSTNISFFVLLYLLDKKVGGFNPRDLWMPGLKMLVSAITAALALYIPLKALDRLVIDTTRTGNLLLLTGIASAFGLAIYVLLVWLMDVKELNTFVNLIKRFTNLQKNIVPEEIPEEQAGGGIV